MAKKNPKDVCPVCQKAILSDPSHFSGEPAAHPQMLRCLLYEMYMLASSANALRFVWPSEMVHSHPTLGPFTPNEGLKRSALVSFRLLYDFLYNPKSRDDFSVDAFQQFSNRPQLPVFVGLGKGTGFTRKSINMWVAHLTWVRINKPECVPQPKFASGDEAIVKNARLLLTDAKAFVESVTDVTTTQRISLDESGQGYWAMFNAAFVSLAT